MVAGPESRRRSLGSDLHIISRHIGPRRSRVGHHLRHHVRPVPAAGLACCRDPAVFRGRQLLGQAPARRMGRGGRRRRPWVDRICAAVVSGLCPPPCAGHGRGRQTRARVAAAHPAPPGRGGGRAGFQWTARRRVGRNVARNRLRPRRTLAHRLERGADACSGGVSLVAIHGVHDRTARQYLRPRRNDGRCGLRHRPRTAPGLADLCSGSRPARPGERGRDALPVGQGQRSLVAGAAVGFLAAPDVGVPAAVEAARRA